VATIAGKLFVGIRGFPFVSLFHSIITNSDLLNYEVHLVLFGVVVFDSKSFTFASEFRITNDLNLELKLCASYANLKSSPAS